MKPTPTTLQHIPLAHLREDPGNARQSYDKASLQGLADSIKAEGILQPLLILPGDTSGTFTILDGHRRFRAAQLANLSVVPCILREDFTDEGARIAAIVANLQREGLTPWEEAKAMQAAVVLGITQKDLAAKTGLSPRTIASRLTLLPMGEELGERIGHDGFTIEHAQMLAPLNDPEFYVGLGKPEPKQTQEDADATLRAKVLDAALKATGSGKGALTVADAVEAVAAALDAANLAFDTTKDAKLIAASAAAQQGIKKMRHIVLKSRADTGGATATVVFDVAAYKEKRLAWRAHAKSTPGTAGPTLSKAERAKAAKRRENVAAALDLTLRDAIIAAKPGTGTLCWAMLHEARSRPITDAEVGFALRLANVQDERALVGFRGLFATKDETPVLKAAPKWWENLSADQPVRLVLGLWTANSLRINQAGDLVQHLTGKSVATWTAEVEALVKDEPEPLIAP